MTSEFHGRGASFPLRVSGGGGIRESASAELIEESIRVVLGTQHGERVMRPTFGCNLRSFVFAPLNDSTISMARHAAEEGLTRWEPRIELLAVDIRPETELGVLVVEVKYRIKATQETRSLVYPFYVQEA